MKRTTCSSINRLGRKPVKRPLATTAGHDQPQETHALPEANAQAHGSGLLLALEQRILFDGAAVATGAEVLQETTTQEATTIPGSAGEASTESTSAETVDDALWASGLSLAAPSDRKEIVFIDTSVDDYHMLMEGIAPNAEVILLDPTRDGMEQMAEILGERSDIDAVHLISHGNSGELRVGTGVLNVASMQGEHADELAIIKQALAEEADWLIYGCHFGEGEAGKEAAHMLADLTGADVAASDDLTGHADLGGDWELEYEVGEVESEIVFSVATQAEWEYLLPNSAPVLTNAYLTTMTTITEDDTNPAGDTVAAIIASSGMDIITDADGDPEGIAVINGDSPFTGEWQYSIDGGSNWGSLAGLSSFYAVLLDGTSLVRFVPDADFNGIEGFGFVAWDQTTGSVGQFVDASIRGGSTAFSTTSEGAQITVTAVNDAPVITNLGGDTLAYTEGDGAVVIDQNAAAVVSDVDSSDFDTGSLTVSIESGASADDRLFINQADGLSLTLTGGLKVNHNGVSFGTVTGGTGGTDLVITFDPDADATAVTALVKNITYENTDTDNPTTGNRTVRYVLTDGDGGTSANYDTTVTVSAANDAPVNAVPFNVLTALDTAVVFSSGNSNQISVSDVDAGGSDLEVTLSVTNGTLTLAGTTGLSFTSGDGTADTTMTFTGTVSAINSALNGLSYTPATSFRGLAQLAITTDDQGNSGSGGAQSDSDTIDIHVGAIVVTNTTDTSNGTLTSKAALISNDGGDGISLREAMTVANADTGTDYIYFEIAGAGPHSIALSSALPDITDTVIIDGTTEPDYGSTPIIELDGSSAGSVDGLRLISGSDGSTIRGLVINQFGGDGIEINGSDNHTIAGNYIGLGTDGVTDEGNTGRGVYIRTSTGNTIGGSTVAARNVISGNTDKGVLLHADASGNTVSANIIGLDATGTIAVQNGNHGIDVEGDSNTIGGTTTEERNIISNNVNNGVEIDGDNNVVVGNYIGTDITGTLDRGNTKVGVYIGAGASGNMIGGTLAEESNTIAFNDGRGIRGDAAAGTGNAFLRNAIFSNGDLGIDLTGGTENGFDVTANDSGDADTGANNLQNFPVLTSAQTTGTQITIVGTLNSSANSYYRIEFFSSATQDGSGHGEAETYLGFVNVATDGSGDASFNTTLTASVASGAYVTATATKSVNTYSTFTDTSEFALNATVNAVPVITNLGGDTLAYTEGDGAVVIDQNAAAVVSDVDSSDFDTGSLTVSIESGASADDRLFINEADGLSFTLTGDLKVNHNGVSFGTVTGGTGGTDLVITFDPDADATAVTALVKNITYENTDTDTPTAGNRTVRFVLTDGDGGTSANYDTTVTVTAVNDAPVEANIEGTALAYTENDAATAITSTLTLSDVDDTQLDSAVIQITGNYVNGEDVLAFTNQNGITGSWNATTGTLTLTGSATLANYQSALRSVTYVNSSEDPSTATRTVSFTVNDGDTNSNTLTRNITVTAVNDAPTDLHYTQYLGGTEFIVNSTVANNQDTPDVTTLASGEFVVVWESWNQDGSDNGVYFQRYDANGVAQGGETQVNSTTTDDQGNPHVVALSNGNFAVTWVSNLQDGSDLGVYVRVFTATGTAVTGEIAVNTTTTNDQEGVRIAALTGGGFVVTWESDGQDGDQKGIYSQRYDNSGIAQGGETQVHTTTAGNQFDPRVGALNDGGYLIVWDSNATGSNEIMAQRFDAAGAAVGSEFQVNTTTAGSQDDGVITALTGGGFVVIWESNGQDGSDDGLFGQRFNASGTAIGGEFQINTTVTNDQVQVSVVSLDDGGFLVSWQSLNQDGDSYGVYAQQFDASATKVNGEFQINTTTAKSQADVELTVLQDGRVVAVYESNLQDGDGDTVVGRIFTPTLNENSPNGTVVAVASQTIDPDDDNGFTYSLVDNAGGAFAINSATGQITVANSSLIDYETASSMTVTVRVADSGSLTHDEVVTIALHDVNEAPTDLHYTQYLGGTEFIVNSTVANNQDTPDVTTLANGEFVVVWESFDQDGSGYGVYFQRYDANGTAQGSETPVNSTTTDAQGDPRIVALSNGNFAVAWDSNLQDGSDLGVYARVFDATGTALTGEIAVNTTTTDDQNDVRIAALTGGGFVVTWESDGQDGDQKGIYSQRYDNSGVAQGGETQVHTTTAGSQFDPRVGALNDGGYLIVWDSNATGSSEIMAQRFDAAGAAVGSEFQVNTTTADSQDDGVITALTGGGFVVIWESNGQDGSDDGLFGQRFNASGTAIGGEFQINTTVTNDQLQVSVVSLDDGGFLVSWHSWAQDGDSNGVYAQQFDASANKVNGEFQINTTTANSQADVELTVLQDGRVVAIYESAGQDGDNDTVVGRIFTPTLNENSPNGTVVAIASQTIDPDDDNGFTYSLVDNAGGAFAINSATGQITVANSSLIDYEAASSMTVTVRVTDSGSLTHDEVVTIQINDVNDAPVEANIEGTALAYTENDAATAITSTLTLSDVDDTQLESAVIQITGNYGTGEDVLAFTNQNGIAGSWNATTGTLSLSGTATVAEYQSALRSVTYANSSEDPSTATRTVSFTVNDGEANSNTLTRDIALTAVNDAPVEANIEGTALAYTENDAATAITSTLTLSDVDDTQLESAVIQITGNYGTGEDVLAFTNQNGIAGSWNATTGTLSLSGTATVAEYQSALRSVTYANSSEDPSTATRTVSFTVNDGEANSNTLTRDIALTAVNDAPVEANIEGTALAYTENDAATAITSTLTLSDVDDTQLESAVIQITGNYGTGEDVLAFTNQNGIAGSWNATTGTLSLSGTATVAEYQSALRSVTYANSSEDPSTATRTVSFTVNDGEANSNTLTRDIALTAVNDAPVEANIEGTALAYTENDAATAITSTLTLSDVDDTQLESAVIQITGNYGTGEDVLAFTNQNGIAGSWNATTGTLSLSGTATVAEYQSALRSVTYANSSEDPSTATRTVSFTVNDGEANSNTLTRDIALTAVNDAPVEANIEGTALAYTENDAATAITSTLTLSDVDDTQLESAVIQITGNYGTGEDVLAFTNQNGIAGSWNATTGTLSLSGTATVAEYQSALRSVTYANSSEDPSTATRTVSFTVNDGEANSNTLTRDIALTAVNDAPVEANIEGTALAYTENDAATAITSTLTLSDVDDTQLESAVIQITGNYGTGEDVLAFTNQNGIAGSWNATTGTLSLSGTATVAEYQSALRSVTYANSSEDPSTATRTVSFTVNDGEANSNTLTRDIALTAVNDAPVEANIEGTALAYTENDAATAITSTLTLSDVDDTQLESAVIQITGNYGTGEDVLAFTNQNGIAGSWNATTGTLSLSGTATVAEYQSALRSVTYANSSEDPSTATRTVSFTVNDGEANSNTLTRDIALTAVNDAPVEANIEGTALAYTENDAATAITSTLTLSDVDDTQLESAVIQITGNYGTGEDVLAFTNQNGIAGSWNATTGTLSLSGTATVAEYQSALRSVTYANSSEDPSTATRTVSFTVNDGEANSNTLTRDISITPVNDAPVSTGTNAATVAEGGTVTLTTAMLGEADVDDSGTGLTYTVTSGPANGQLELTTNTGVAITSFTQDDIDNNRVVFVHNGSETTTDSFGFSLADGGENGAVADTGTFNLTVSAVNDVPVITNLGGDTLNYTEGAGAAVIDQSSNAAVSDVDSSDFDTGTLTVAFAGGEDTAEDVLAIRDQGAGATNITVAGNAVSYGGTQIGTFTGGTGVTDLVITLESAADATAVSALLQNITYENTDTDNPTTGNRTMRYVLTDGDGGTSANYDTTVAVTAVNDAPEVTNLGGDTLTYTEGAGAAVIDQSSNAAVSDVDSSDFDTGTLTVAFAGGEDTAEDVLSIRDQGAGATNITVAGNAVSYGGTQIGTFTGGTGVTDLVITLESAADATAVSALLQNITYENTDTDNPTTGNRTVRYVLTDGDGGTSANYDTTVAVTAVNDAPVIGAPGSALSATEQTPLVIDGTGFTVSDADEAGVGATATMTVGEGTLTVSVGDSGVTIDSGNGTGTVVLSGTIAQIDRLLTGAGTGTLTYLNPSDNPSASTTLTLTVNDAGNTGADPGLSGDGSSEEDSNSVSITLTAVNDAPVLTSDGGGPTANLHVLENQASVTTMTATDVDGDALMYRIVGGADAAAFALDSATGALSFVASPDYEDPSDFGEDNRYEVQVQVSDGQGGTDMQTLVVSVADGLEGTPPPLSDPLPEPSPDSMSDPDLMPDIDPMSDPMSDAVSEPTAPALLSRGVGNGSDGSHDRTDAGIVRRGPEERVSASASEWGEVLELPPVLRPKAWLITADQLRAYYTDPVDMTRAEWSTDFLAQLNTFSEEFEENIQEETEVRSTFVNMVKSAGFMLSTGLVAWMIRGGTLLAWLMAAIIPSWRYFDPVPVLGMDKKDQEAWARRVKESATMEAREHQGLDQILRDGKKQPAPATENNPSSGTSPNSAPTA